MREGWVETTLDELVVTGVVSLGRGNVISKRDMDADPGPYPVYSSAQNNDGRIGSYNKFMFDEELITWSVDGGGYVFYRPHHKFSVTNIGGYLRILDSTKFLYPFLAAVLQKLHSQHVFDWQNKAHPSVIRNLYNNIPLATLDEQKRIIDLVSSVDSYIESLQSQVDSARTARNAVLHELLSAGGDDWTETNLGEVSEVIMGRQLSPSKKMGTRPRPYLRAANIGNWGISIDDVLEMDFTEEEETHFACRKGDVLLVEGGNEKSVGCPALVSDRELGLCIQNTIIRCRIKDENQLRPDFLYHSLRHSFWNGKFGELCAGTTIMHLGQKRAVVFPIQIPPLDEQKRIVQIVSSMDDVIHAAEQAVLHAKNVRSGLLSDLLSGKHEIPSSYDKFLKAA